MSLSDKELLDQLIATFTRDLAFYQDAALRAERPEHQAIFKRMAIARSFAIDYLKPLTHDDADSKVHAFGSLLHKMYPEILLGLDDSADAELIQQSTVVEAATLKAVREALESVGSPLVKCILKDLCPRVNGTYQNNSCWDKAS